MVALRTNPLMHHPRIPEAPWEESNGKYLVHGPICLAWGQLWVGQLQPKTAVGLGSFALHPPLRYQVSSIHKTYQLRPLIRARLVFLNRRAIQIYHIELRHLALKSLPPPPCPKMSLVESHAPLSKQGNRVLHGSAGGAQCTQKPLLWLGVRARLRQPDPAAGWQRCSH